MNKRGKSWHLIVTALLIVVFSFTALFGVSYTYGDTKNVYIKGAEDIRFGIDIRGGVDVTFMPADGVEATDDQMTAAKTVIEDRLVGLGITDYEDYVAYNKDRIIVRFPWKTGETDFNPQTAIDEIGTTAEMVFRKGSTADGEEILSGDDVTSATAGYNQENGYVVQLQFSATRREHSSQILVSHRSILPVFLYTVTSSASSPSCRSRSEMTDVSGFQRRWRMC